MQNDTTNPWRPDPLNGFFWVVATSFGLFLTERELVLGFGFLEIIVGVAFIRPHFWTIVRFLPVVLVPVVLLAGFHTFNELDLWESLISDKFSMSHFLSADAVYYPARIFIGAIVAAIYVTSYSASEVAWAFSKLGIPAAGCIALQISLSAIPIFMGRFRDRMALFKQRDLIRGRGNSIRRFGEVLYMLPVDATGAADSVTISLSSRGFTVAAARKFVIDVYVNFHGILFSSMGISLVVVFLIL